MKPSLFREALIFIKIITKRVLVLLIRYRIGRILFVNITLRKFKIIRFISIENAHKNYPDRIEILHKYSKKLSYSEPNYHGHKLNSDKIGNIDGFDNYVLLVKDAKITGCSNLIELDDGSGIYEIKFRDLENIINYSDEKFVFHSKNQGVLKNNQTNNFIDEGILLADNYSGNYYHLMFEYIVKFELINSNIIRENVPIIVDERVLNVFQYVEIINYCNIRKRPIIALNEMSCSQVANLYYISTPNHIPPNIKNEKDLNLAFFSFQLDTIDYLIKLLLPHKSVTRWSKRIFISRENASGWRKYNENEIFDTLSYFGFEKVHPEKVSIADQIAMFHNAEIIVGGSGAAFTNILFCRKDCKIVALTAYNLPLTIFSTIAKHLNLNFIYLSDENADITKKKSLHDDFHINTYTLIERLREFEM